MKDWFTVDQVDESTYIISEYRHWEETYCYLLIGNDRALLIDTGLGISNIYEQVRKLTNKPVAAVATHIHWDHIGGHKYFPEFYAHEAERDWLNGKFPLPLQAVKNMVADRCELHQTNIIRTRSSQWEMGSVGNVIHLLEYHTAEQRQAEPSQDSPGISNG